MKLFRKSFSKKIRLLFREMFNKHCFQLNRPRLWMEDARLTIKVYQRIHFSFGASSGEIVKRKISIKKLNILRSHCYPIFNWLSHMKSELFLRIRTAALSEVCRSLIEYRFFSISHTWGQPFGCFEDFKRTFRFFQGAFKS